MWTEAWRGIREYQEHIVIEPFVVSQDPKTKMCATICINREAPRFEKKPVV